jgi:hypothetical protein
MGNEFDCLLPKKESKAMKKLILGGEHSYLKGAHSWHVCFFLFETSFI